jgi:hypothetical protein
MNALKPIGFIAAAILIFFGVLFIWGATSPQGGGGAWILIGVISVIIGFVIIYFAARKEPTPPSITYKVDLPAEVNMDTIKCKSCGGTITSADIQIVAGAPVATCPFCKTSFQLTEEPKW